MPTGEPGRFWPGLHLRALRGALDIATQRKSPLGVLMGSSRGPRPKVVAQRFAWIQGVTNVKRRYDSKRLSDIVRSPVLMDYMQELSAMREQRTGDILRDVSQGASTGLDLFLRILPEGTEKNRTASTSVRVNVARDLLDREGSAPRVGKRQTTYQESGLHFTSEDIERLKPRGLERRSNTISPG